MDTEAWKLYIKLKIYKLQQIFRPRIISDKSTSEKLYDREIKMYFYLAMLGFEPTPTSTAAPSNTETTVIPSRPLRSLKNELSRSRFMLDIYSLSIRKVNVYICTLEVDESAKYSRPSLRKVYLNNSSKHPTVLAQVGNTPQSGSSPSGSQIYQFV